MNGPAKLGRDVGDPGGGPFVADQLGSGQLRGSPADQLLIIVFEV